MNAHAARLEKLRLSASAMLTCCAFAADFARLELEKIAEKTDEPARGIVEAADAIDAAILAIASARNALSE
ncbi:MAG: hypothetical protein V4673_15395 [Pseudomonadota bacterium]